ncbi:Fic family protein [Nocardioides sp. YIM 152588]|uniref:Fic family protein n=1 Tax=Nocardioides sp. YIM 152588 TaxID=3158259 RepID=UPI0032E4A0C7
MEVEVPAAIAGLRLDLQPATLRAGEEASRAVADLEGRAHHLSGIGDLLVRTESVASSKIEHVYADLDDIARASLGADAGAAARRTVAASRAVRALSAATDGGAPLTERAILGAHRELLRDDRVEGAHAGRYRRVQNWIGGSDFTPRGAIHVPPPHDLVEPLMRDLVAFANRGDLGGVPQPAIAHAQFEAIHPFTDGNGRVGRAIIGAVLRRRGVTRSVTVPIAAAMLADVDAHFDRLDAYRAGDPDPIVAHLAESAIAAAGAAAVSADHLASLPTVWRQAVPARRGSSVDRLLAGLLDHPILDIALAREVSGSTPIRTYEALDRLTDAGVLDEITGRGRNRVWVAADVMAELGELERRIGLRAKPSDRWR